MAAVDLTKVGTALKITDTAGNISYVRLATLRMAKINKGGTGVIVSMENFPDFSPAGTSFTTATLTVGGATSASLAALALAVSGLMV